MTSCFSTLDDTGTFPSAKKDITGWLSEAAFMLDFVYLGIIREAKIYTKSAYIKFKSRYQIS